MEYQPPPPPSQPPEPPPPAGYEPAAPPASPKSSMGLEPNVASGLAYLCGWLTGLIFFLIEKTNPLVRFHALQSILAFGTISLLFYALRTIEPIPIIGIIWWAWPLIAFLGAVVWVICLIKAFQGERFKLPIVGDIAERNTQPSPDAEVARTERSKLSMDPNQAGALCYLFGCLSGIIFFLIETENKRVRFHALQSLILFLILAIISIGSLLLAVFGGFEFFNVIYGLLGMVQFALWLYLVVKTALGYTVMIPAISDFVRQTVGWPETKPLG